MAFIDKARSLLTAGSTRSGVQCWAVRASAADWCRSANRPWNTGRKSCRVNLIGPFLAIKYSHAAHDQTEIPVRSSARRPVAGLKAGASGHPYGARQGRRHQPGAGPRPIRCRAPACASTRVCPGLIETGTDQADLRQCQGARHRPQDRPAQPAQAAPVSRMSWRQWDFFSPAMMRPMSTDRTIPVDGGLTASMPVCGQTDLAL